VLHASPLDAFAAIVFCVAVAALYLSSACPPLPSAYTSPFPFTIVTTFARLIVHTVARRRRDSSESCFAFVVVATVKVDKYVSLEGAAREGHRRRNRRRYVCQLRNRRRRIICVAGLVHPNHASRPDFRGVSSYTSAPALVHAPALVNVIANPELALATTVKLLLLVAVAGAGTVTVIVWLA